MTALLIVLMVLAFVVIDVLVRMAGQRLAEARARREREAALDASVRLEVSPEAPSLRRVEVPGALARILAVDDEPVVLDSFRKILVLEGFDVDTVESGPEALGLVQRCDYDFVFTDLKMPGMDGVEVVKAVKHLRPDVDVAVITGYGTIETAVETMQHGALDYVQKPFTPDELNAFARRLLHRRQARLEAQRRPSVRIVSPAAADTAEAGQFCVPGGAFLSAQHAWVRIEPDGLARVGIDDFARKALGGIDTIDLPEVGRTIDRGAPLFTLHRGPHTIVFPAPVSGACTHVNAPLARHPAPIVESPYQDGWICVIRPADVASEIADLRIGRPVVAWYQQEIERFRKTCRSGNGPVPPDWETLDREFFGPRAAGRAPAGVT